ncbi:hypothetical protein [Methanosphaerula palustris]|uniref:hypothetical protein n=1 Tax=Methanosphaerula palustris TaxID=475088 RepID=UPI0001848C06|nr:hypothetical protein [Methanosphaerula palustris]
MIKGFLRGDHQKCKSRSTGALGSTEIARANWEHGAIGAAISVITLVCGENVCGIDPGLVRDNNGKVQRSPEMDRRIEIYRKFHKGLGEILVQITGHPQDRGLLCQRTGDGPPVWF